MSWIGFINDVIITWFTHQLRVTRIVSRQRNDKSYTSGSQHRSSGPDFMMLVFFQYITTIISLNI